MAAKAHKCSDGIRLAGQRGDSHIKVLACAVDLRSEVWRESMPEIVNRPEQ
jgi:hypothetical protein